MELINFDEYRPNKKVYGGTAGRKIGITFHGEDYLIKFPGNLKVQKMKNIQLSYSNGPVCEYIGSHIYEILDIPVHETLLGERNGRIVVACKDFLEEGDMLYEFDKIKVTYEPAFLDSNGNETNGTGVDLYEILMTIRNHPLLADIPGIEERFWDMFVVDALIGNPDRNNSNWGIILDRHGEARLTPVYDNGNCLVCKWDEEKMRLVLSDPQIFQTELYQGRRCIFELKGKKINPYHLIRTMENEGCTEAVKRIVPKLAQNLDRIEEMIHNIPVLSEVQKELYCRFVSERLYQVLQPAYNQIIKQKCAPENTPAKIKKEGWTV